MTSLDQPGQPSKDDHKRGEDGNRPAVRSSRSGRQNRHLGRRYKSRRFWIGLSAIALLGLAGVFIYVGVGGTHHAASSGSSGTAQGRNSAGGAPPKGTSTAEGKVISAAKLAENGGALALPKSMQASALKWQSGPGGRDLAAVSSRLGQALQAAGIRQYSQMKSACIQLAASVATAEVGPQIPDATMQKLYAKALAELTKGASDCRSAISSKVNGGVAGAHVNTAMLYRSTSELSTGATDIFRSTAEIEIISRQS